MSITASRSLHLVNLLWIAAGCVVGVITATQPIAFVVVCMALITLLILSAITPLAALVFLLIIAPLRTLMNTEAAFQLPLDVGQIAMIGFIGAWLIYRVTHEKDLLNLTGIPLGIPLLLFLGAAALSLFSAHSLGAGLSEWLKWVQISLLVVFVWTLCQAASYQWLLVGLAAAGAANALIGLYEFFGGSGAVHLLINDRFFRAFGTFGQPNPFGGFMGLIAPVMLMSTLGYGLRVWHFWRLARQIQWLWLFLCLFYLACAALVISGIFVSWSRGAWLSFALAVGVMIFALPRNFFRSFAFLLSMVAIASILWFSGRLPQTIITRVNSATAEFLAFQDMRGVDITPENYPVVERLAHWQAAVNMINAHPIFGVGFGNYEVVYPQFRLLNWKFPLGHAHNYYLNIWAETGMIGFTAYCVLWLTVLWFTWQTRSHPDLLARCVTIGLLGTWTYLLAHSFFDNLYVNNLFLHIGVLLGILAVLHNQIWKHTLWGKN